MIEGKLQRVIETASPQHLQLDGHKLNAGCALDVRVGEYWIEGRVECDPLTKSWYLTTDHDSDPHILLRPGVVARIDENW